MKRNRPRLDSARFRILFLAVVAIVIPGIILAGFGFNLSIEHRYRTEDVVRRAYRAAADSTIGGILNQIQEEEREILYDLASLSESRALPFTTGRLATRPIAEHYFLLSPAFEVLYPPTRQEYVPQPVESRPGPGGRGAEALLEAGYKLEFGEGDLQAAAKKYQTCANGPFSASPRVEALLALGSCFFQLGMFEQAIHAHGRVSREFEPKDVAVPQRLLAQSEICRAHEAAGLRVEAVRRYLDAYEGLLREPSSASGADTWEFFCEKTRRELTRLMSSDGLAPEYRERFEELRRSAEVREGERQFRLDLERWLAQRIEWESRGKGFEPGRLSHSYKLLDGGPYVFACTRLVGEGDGPSVLAGYKMRLDYVKRKVLLPQVIERKIGTGTLTTVLDREGESVLPLDVSDASAPREAEKYALLREFPSILEFWQLGILDRGNEELLAVTRNQELLITSLLGLTIAVMMAGLYLTLRAVNRELELSRLKSDFVSNVSHELKTPLTLIRMFAETLMLGRAKTKDKEQEYYRIITRESERLTQLIDNVLDFSRIESGRKQYQFAIEDVGELARITVESYRDEMEQRGFRVDVDIDGEAFAKIDQPAIAQALLNLVSNAEKYSSDRKEITVSVKTDQDEIRIAVRDRGIGISQTDQARIFEKFFRAEDDFVRAVRGSGLGLAIANHMLEAHGGRIELDSEPGEGSTFALVLPRCTKEGVHGDISKADEPSPSEPPSEPGMDRAAGEPPLDCGGAENARESRGPREPSSQRP